ncbi:MAG: tRNA lysidine(34) synthetase TilS [Alphaproteobacteria bacterium]|nr:tRNA lysidine(34) synthetase TilS [Alphaproteobacteria bacterium]MBQ6854316.1 tRNA lysidine(34) synthetase TilS [Alphaproteobacteria bacterium]MBQ8557694.1 tRNA lysidine(34) synthetase TilS [Alphaproteobacteria bacterium]MBR3913787.1 tRNA lysidine(34) synthetase TilS [Alphaproteobacteria bacterium]
MSVLNLDDFDKLMQPFVLSSGMHIAVGVSGGADSLCLTLLLSEWAQKHKIELTAITVNHNLRAVACQEAEAVHRFLTQKNIHHVVLTNQKPIPESGLEVYARQVRYDLLTDYCQQHQICDLFLAHHQSDQAETFLLRLAKSTGLNGLVGMKMQSIRNGLKINRPFLSVPKQDLTDTLNAHQISWFEDEMNTDERYERVKWRNFLPLLAEKGISLKALTQTMQRLHRADKALNEYTQTFIDKYVWIDFRGFARLPVEKWEFLPEEIKIRIILYLIQIIGQSEKQVSLKSVENLCEQLPCHATLGNCIFVPHKLGLYIGKENNLMASEKKLKVGETIVWDRFKVSALTDCIIKSGMPKKKLENIPAIIQKSFPAVFIEKELEKIVQIDYKEKNDSSVRIEFLKCNQG